MIFELSRHSAIIDVAALSRLIKIGVTDFTVSPKGMRNRGEPGGGGGGGGDVKTLRGIGLRRHSG